MAANPVYRALASLPLPAPPATIQRWIPTQSPFSTHTEVLGTLALYIAVIIGGQWLMTDRKALRLKPLFMLHNAMLSIGSGLLLMLMLEEIVPIWWKNVPFYSICHTNAWTPKLEMYYIINYYFKYWELIDTVFLVLKKKPIQFLHFYHHPATALLCYVQLNGRTSVSWVPITLNLGVHVVMYYYYFASTAGYKIWWKKYITVLQITQFVIDLAVVYFAAYSYFAAEYFPAELPTLGSCSGTEGAAVMGCALLSSYLLLFVDFYRRSYKKAPRPAVAGKKSSTAIADFKKTN